MARSGQTTIADIARAAGVSRWIVSAVLFPSEKNRNTRFGEEAKQRVLAAAERLHYRPNFSARNLLQRKHGVIGVLTANFFTIPWTSIFAMIQVASRHGQLISFESFDVNAEALPKFIREDVVDGLILFENVPQRISDAIALHRMPAIQVNACRHGANAINMDESGAIARALRLFADQGRKRPALVVELGSAAAFEQERKAAFAAAGRELGLRGARVLPWSFYIDAEAHHRQFEQVRAVLSGRDAPDALILPHLAFVTVVMHACRAIGRTIPEDLAIICMQDPPILLALDPPVSAFSLPEIDLGSLAVEQLQRLIAGADGLDEILLPYAFSTRLSQ